MRKPRRLGPFSSSQPTQTHLHPFVLPIYILSLKKSISTKKTRKIRKMCTFGPNDVLPPSTSVFRRLHTIYTIKYHISTIIYEDFFKKRLPLAQTTQDTSFGPIFVISTFHLHLHPYLKV